MTKSKLCSTISEMKFDREPRESCPPEERREETKYFKLVKMIVGGWLYANRGKSFSIERLDKELEIDRKICERALADPEILPLFAEKTEPSGKRFYSVAPELPATEEGLAFEAWLEDKLRNDPLGAEAIQEFWWQSKNPPITRKKRLKSKKI